MKQRGMDAVIAKSAKRKPVLKRKGGEPSIVIAVGGAPPKPSDEAEVPDALECPKCGRALADTPENREYIASKSSDDHEEASDEDEDEDEY